MKQTIHSNLRVFADKQLLCELQAGNLIESKEGRKLVLTSVIPKDGIEFNPDIDQKVHIDYLISNLRAKMTVSCTEKKLSKSTNKEAYQLLTFNVLELKWVDMNEEIHTMYGLWKEIRAILARNVCSTAFKMMISLDRCFSSFSPG